MSQENVVNEEPPVPVPVLAYTENPAEETENPLEKVAPTGASPAEATPSVKEQKKGAEVVAKSEQKESTAELEMNEQKDSTEEPVNLETTENAEKTTEEKKSKTKKLHEDEPVNATQEVIDEITVGDPANAETAENAENTTERKKSMVKKVEVDIETQEDIREVPVELNEKEDDEENEVNEDKEGNEDKEKEVKAKKVEKNEEEDSEKTEVEEKKEDHKQDEEGKKATSVPMDVLIDTDLIEEEDEKSVVHTFEEHKETANLFKDFLETFGAIPSLDSISPDVSYASLVSVVTTQSDGGSGKFVDPISAEILDREEYERAKAKFEKMPEQEELKQEMASEEEEGSEETDQFILPAEFDYDTAVEENVSIADEALVTFLHLEDKPLEEEVIDAQEFMLQQTEKYVKDSTAHFLHSLINAAVNAGEYVDPREKLREHLDKKKLVDEILTKLRQLQVERKELQFLDRKVAAYFQRKKLMHCITQGHQSVPAEGTNRFHGALENLNILKRKEEKLKKTNSQKLKMLEEQLNERKTMYAETVEQFENMVKNALKRAGFTHLKTNIEIRLRTMAKTREEISKIRKDLMLKQHSYASVTEKLDACGDLSEGFKLSDFDQLLMAIGRFENQNEEFNNDLTKSRNRYYADLHKLCHTTQALNMMRHQAKIDAEALEILNEKKLDAREVLYQEKLEQARLNKELATLSFQCGIMDKPALMIDFDESAIKLDAARKRVAEARLKLAHITEKVRILQAKVDEN